MVLCLLRCVDERLAESLNYADCFPDVVLLEISNVLLPRFKLFVFVCICHFFTLFRFRHVPQAMTLDGLPDVTSLPLLPVHGATRHRCESAERRCTVGRCSSGARPSTEKQVSAGSLRFSEVVVG